MTTKNEYIASIMLEAAELLKMDDSYYEYESIREDYYNYQLLMDSVNESIALCESLGRILDKYENNIYYSLNESVGSAIWGAIKKLFRTIRGWWNKFRKWIKGGKRVAKKNSEVVDPSKAKKVVDQTLKAYKSNSDPEQYEATINTIENSISYTKKKVKEGDYMPDYESLGDSVDVTITMLEKDCDKAEAANDEEKAKRAKEALNIINKMNKEITKSSEIFLLPEGDTKVPFKEIHDKNGNRKRTRNGEEILGRSSVITRKYRSGELSPHKEFIRYYDSKGNLDREIYGNYRTGNMIVNRPGKDPKFRSFRHDTKNNKPLYVDEKGVADTALSKRVREARKKKAKAKAALQEAIDLLYDKAILCEDSSEAEGYVQKAEELQKAIEDIPEETPVKQDDYETSTVGGDDEKPDLEEIKDLCDNDPEVIKLLTDDEDKSVTVDSDGETNTESYSWFY